MQNLSNYGATLAEAEQHLRNLEPFHTGTLNGEWLINDEAQQYPRYCVFSYGVAIAMTINTPIVKSAVVFDYAYNYSKTTSKHANLVKKAWGI